MNAVDLKRFSLLADFGDDEREELCELLESERLATGEVLFREGDEADALYFVAGGSLRLHSKACGNLGLLCEGTSLGAISLVVIGSREASAVAESDAEIYVLTRAGFRRFAEDAPRSACRLVEAVITHLASGIRPHLSHIKRQFSLDEVVHSG